MNVRRLPIRALAALLEDPTAVDERSLRALRRDPRAGARAIGVRLGHLRDRLRREARRADDLISAERAYAGRGEVVAGVDEAGRGPLAGPVVAAAVVLRGAARLRGLDDSKVVPPARRATLAVEIGEAAAAVAIGVAEVEEVDRLNVRRAALLAMRRAVEALELRPDLVLVDGRDPIPLPLRQRPVVDADATLASVAAASIVAKVYRDRLMEELDARFPEYGFARHKGYGTEEHLAALERWGPSPVHRRTFVPVRALGLFDGQR